MDKPLSILKTKTLDKYEEAIEYLMEHPEKIIDNGGVLLNLLGQLLLTNLRRVTKTSVSQLINNK